MSGGHDLKALVRQLLSGIETGDPSAAKVVNESVYIQHNPRTKTGGPGLAELFARLAKMSPKVNFHRVFSDGAYGFAHNQYIFSGEPEIAFEVFRFEDGLAVEHWDNLAPQQPPNASGRGMLDGDAELRDTEHTEANREFVRAFVEECLIGKQPQRLGDWVDATLAQHDPLLSDGAGPMTKLVEGTVEGYKVEWVKLHKLLCEGNFALAMCECLHNGVPSGIFNLFRISREGGSPRIVEHWDTIDAIAPKEEWKNDNGKF